MLELNNISKNLGGQQLIKNFSLSVNKGEIVSIVGESGSGKSTLIRILNQLESPDEGSIHLDSKSLYSDGRIKKESNEYIGLVFQDFQLFPNLTVIENCTLSPVLNKKLSKDEARKKAEDLLSKLGLAHKMLVYPKELSGGQKQRVAIARALMLNPEIVCLDEPTSALDYETANQFGQLLLSLLEEDLGIIMITHDTQFAEKYSSRIISSESFINKKVINND